MRSGAGVGQDPGDAEAERAAQYLSGSSNGNGSSDGGGWFSDFFSGVGDVFGSTLTALTGAATQRLTGLVNPTTGAPATGAHAPAGASATPSWLWPVLIGGGALIVFGAMKSRRL